MNPLVLPRKICALESALVRQHEKLAALKRRQPREPVADCARCGPFDPFCPTWHFFALLAEGVDDWAPKYRY